MIVAIDIGGTNTRIALMGSELQVIGKVSFETQQDIHSEVSHIVEVISSMPATEVTRVIVGAPGLINEQGVVISSPNLCGWEQENIKELLSSRIHVPIVIVNDAELAALGEATYGAGKNYVAVAYYTISTGIGGARIINKTFDTSLAGFEPGRQIIDAQNLLTLQDIASGAAVRRETGVAPREVTDEIFWKHKAEALAIGVWNSMVHWSPQIIIFGGPMILKKPGIELQEVEEVLEHISNNTLPIPILALAELGDDVALFGALALENLLAAQDNTL